MSDPGPTSSALELAAALRGRELSAVELLDACLASVDAHNGDVNAIVWRDDDAARHAAKMADAALARGDDAAFLGVPIPIKDLTPVAGWPVTYGSRGGPEGVSDAGELTTEAFKRAGFVLCGRTNTPEFGPITVTENERYGITRNPWDLERTPGGSSGGAAAAVASGMFPLAHATDGGGSIRIPAACCGLVGLKPSRGRVPRRAQGWLGGVVEGAVTRTVAETAAILDVLSGPDPRAWYNAPAPDRPFLEESGREPARLRIGLMDHGPNGLPIDPTCAEAARRTAAALEELGHEVVPADVPTLSEELVAPFLVVINASLADYEGVDWDKVEPHVKAAVATARETSSFDYVASAALLERYSRDLVSAWGADFDVLVTPTTAILPPRAGDVIKLAHANPGQPVEPVLAMVAFTIFANITGLPAISLPVHTTEEGFPVGAQLVGAPFCEAQLIRLGHALEEALPWAGRRPALATA
jgi:amidase